MFQHKIMISSKMVNTYIVSSCTYGFIRKIPILYNAKMDYKNNKDECVSKNMLFSDKLTIITLSTVFAPYLLSYNIYNDISYINIKFRNENINEYGYFKPNNIINYIFK